MDEILFYFISVCLFCVIIKESMGIFFAKKDVPCLLFIIIWMVFLLIDILGVKFAIQPIFLLGIETANSFCLCMLLYKGSIRKKLICNVSINLLGMIIETMVGYIFIFANVHYTRTQILGSFISKIILLMIIMILKTLNYTQLKRDISFAYWGILFSIPVGSIFILNVLFSLCKKSEDKNETILCLISSTIILALNFMIFKMYEVLSDKLDIKKQQAIFSKEIELCKNQLQERGESIANIRKLKHDIVNHLICVREYLERREFDYAIIYINDILNSKKSLISNYDINSGNVVVDALLNYKKSVMEQLNIVMVSHIEIPQEFKFNDVDICVILGNCLDNSIEAVSKIKDINKRKINIELIYRKESLIIMVSNPFCGVVKKDSKGNLVTTKSDSENHGIGISSIKNAVLKYDGIVNILTNNNIFKIQILLYDKREKYI